MAKSKIRLRLLVPGVIFAAWFAGTSRADQIAEKTARVEEPDAECRLPNDMKFEPTWRDRGDCGPVSLYVMMRLFDRRIALDEVKRILPFDPELGCSLADVARGGDALGFPAEVRFVKPTDLATLPFPFVLHSMGSLQKGTGHFRVVVRYSPQRRLWSVVDTTFGGFQEETEEAFLQGFSGYVLVPKNSANRIPQHLVTVALVATGCLLGFLAWATPRTREKNVAPRATSAESPCGS